jgi:F0F1-type ATP synthase assembly protein I
MPTRPVRPSSWTTGLVVAGILIFGLVTGLALDALLSTGPIGLLLFPLAAGQVAALVVYRVYVAGLRQISHDSEQSERSQDA